jgi:hypothetical protein
MMEAHYDFFLGDAHLFEFFIDFNISIVFLKPDFPILYIEVKYRIINSSLSFPAYSKEQIMISF